MARRPRGLWGQVGPIPTYLLHYHDVEVEQNMGIVWTPTTEDGRDVESYLRTHVADPSVAGEMAYALYQILDAHLTGTTINPCEPRCASFRQYFGHCNFHHNLGIVDVYDEGKLLPVIPIQFIIK